MELKQSQKQQVKLRLGLSGASGFGKSMSALLLAYGMTEDWSKVAVIDSEHSSSNIYSDLGDFNVLDLRAPYSPERFIQAIETCEKSGIEVIIIDSLSKEWSGTGGCLELHEKLGGRFQDWLMIKKRHQKLIDKILESPCHIITTTRRKTEYLLETGSNGKTQVVKHGTKEITSSDFEYELTINFELMNDKHEARATKDRSSLFSNKSEFVITPAVGKLILEWCNSDITETADIATSTLLNNNTSDTCSKEEVLQKIQYCNTVSDLLATYKHYPEYQEKLKPEYEARKSLLIKLSNPQNFSTNGHSKHN
ncbi:AAA family ATPase [Chryseobacterium fistulae]|uniref:AAA family ATPase n=1 Tax=Chryseobacterium fistulae TaxID=2675058 RepID=A0A6N4XT66_9FLAO|nr:AAA family ATPase [Chryseobacterium fistulae]CAA7386962.1 hypothetical protein CHRY9393_01263 [Chryseobacterium fistulae]